jgi:hypothetical protein
MISIFSILGVLHIFIMVNGDYSNLRMKIIHKSKIVNEN